MSEKASAIAKAAQVLELHQERIKRLQAAVSGMLVWRGDWSTDEIYGPYTIVKHGASMWIANNPQKGEAPTEGDWTEAGRVGSDGKPGVGIKSIEVRGHELFVTLTNGERINAGRIMADIIAVGGGGGGGDSIVNVEGGVDIDFNGLPLIDQKTASGTVTTDTNGNFAVVSATAGFVTVENVQAQAMNGGYVVEISQADGIAITGTVWEYPKTNLLGYRRQRVAGVDVHLVVRGT